MANRGPMSASHSVRAWEYLRARPGEVVHFADVAEAIEAPSAASIGQALSRMVRENPERGIVREGHAMSGKYVYRPDGDNPPRRAPDGPKPGDLFECVGTMGDGRVVVRDPVTFTLYRLEEA